MDSQDVMSCAFHSSDDHKSLRGMEIEPEVSLAGVSGSFHVVIRQLWSSSRAMEDRPTGLYQVFHRLYLLAVALTRRASATQAENHQTVEPGDDLVDHERREGVT
jgi:hypothetical protein